METKDMVFTWTVVLLLVGLLAVSGYGCYKYGRYVERRDLTHVFIQMTSDTYFEGFSDGVQKGIAQAHEELVDEDGRY